MYQHDICLLIRYLYCYTTKLSLLIDILSTNTDYSIIIEFYIITDTIYFAKTENELDRNNWYLFYEF